MATISFLCRLVVVVLMVALGAPAASSDEAAPASGLTQLGPGVAVDVGKREVYLDATVCLRRGILEYLICAKQTFEHESIFAAEGKASHLHLGLLLIGGEPCAYSPTSDWPELARQHPASHLSITVEFDEQGVRQRRSLNQFARNRERADGVVADSWVFTGSVFFEHDGKELYAADSTGGIIGLLAKGASVIQYGEHLGVPYQGDELGLECKIEAIPPAGTPVRVIFSLRDRPAPSSVSPPSAVIPDQPTPAQKP